MPARRTTRIAVLLTALVASLGAAASATDTSGPPREPDCLPLAGGTTGVLVVGGEVPSVDEVTGQPGGFGPRVSRADLPRRIVFKDRANTFSNEYAFALRAGRMYVARAKVGTVLSGQAWHQLDLPACLDGRVSAISADHRLLVVLGPSRQVYSHDMPGGDLAAERWTWRWGPYFWTGSGLKMYDDVRRWATSEFTSAETFTDTSGRRQHPIGVATVYLMRDGGRRITYLDPWLPQDESREVCTPRRGTLPLANLSASGSTVFAVGQRGELFTRLYDFDVAGANTVFGDYSWRTGRPATDTRWQLPGPQWRRQPAPRGVITDRISIAKTGPDAANRLLVVEGRKSLGQAGRFVKSITADRWRFVASGARLTGRRLPLAHPLPYAAPADHEYAGTIGGRPVVVRDFNAECSPASLVVDFGARVRLTLLLHSSDGLRQAMRERGLTDLPREYNGAIEIPAATFRRLPDLPARVRDWVATNLSPGRFTTSPLAVTTTRMRSLSQCWELTLNGDPARPDAVAAPPDLGVVVGRLTEMVKDEREPCLG